MFVTNKRETQTLLENLIVHIAGMNVERIPVARNRRPFQLYREVLLPKVFKKLKLPPNIRASWSQKAGCSCGCSPGFILDTLPLRRGYDAIYVTVS